MQYILTDIEGTTTSIDFVYNTLFPYFINNVHDFITHNKDTSWLKDIITMVQETVQKEEDRNISEDAAVDQLIQWTKADRKHPALKNLQGMVWKSGYEQGILKSHMYNDVLPAFTAWQARGIPVGIYSSGSVAAQKLLFRHSVAGDLSNFISSYFDTTMGNKRETGSYENIIQELNIPAGEILFLSDIEAELDAAATAGMATIQLVREGELHSDHHRWVPDFSTILSGK